MVYNTEMRPAQGLDAQQLDTVNISVDDESLEAVPLGLDHGPVEQKRALFARFNAAPTPEENRRTIIRDWLSECYDADHALFLFRLFKLPIGTFRGSSYQMMAHAAVSEFGYVPLPERVTAPIPSVSSSKPFQPDGGAA